MTDSDATTIANDVTLGDDVIDTDGTSLETDSDGVTKLGQEERSEMDLAFLPSGGRLVLYNNARLTQPEAERKCRHDYRGTLAIVRTEEDFRLVEEYLLPQISE